MDDGDLKDLIDHLEGMLDEEPERTCDCDPKYEFNLCTCDCNKDFEGEFTFPVKLVDEEGKEIDPVAVELTTEMLNIILEKSNELDCGFDSAFCAILQEALDAYKEEEVDEEDNEEDEPQEEGFTAFQL